MSSWICRTTGEGLHCRCFWRWRLAYRASSCWSTRSTELWTPRYAIASAAHIAGTSLHFTPSTRTSCRVSELRYLEKSPRAVPDAIYRPATAPDISAGPSVAGVQHGGHSCGHRPGAALSTQLPAQRLPRPLPLHAGRLVDSSNPPPTLLRMPFLSDPTGFSPFLIARLPHLDIHALNSHAPPEGGGVQFDSKMIAPLHVSVFQSGRLKILFRSQRCTPGTIYGWATIPPPPFPTPVPQSMPYSLNSFQTWIIAIIDSLG